MFHVMCVSPFHIIILAEEVPIDSSAFVVTSVKGHTHVLCMSHIKCVVQQAPIRPGLVVVQNAHLELVKRARKEIHDGSEILKYTLIVLHFPV
jgi:hypothetical protein